MTLISIIHVKVSICPGLDHRILTVYIFLPNSLNELLELEFNEALSRGGCVMVKQTR